MKPAEAAAGTVVITAGCAVGAYCMMRWPQATAVTLSVLAVYVKLRSLEPPKEVTE